MSWDAEVSQDIQNKFRKWLSELYLLPEIKIPRQLSPRALKETWSLHAFCDASQTAYAAVVFLRSVSDEGVSVRLIQAKSRVAPLKSVSIPRLELLACCIGARLVTSIVESLKLEEVPRYFWTDSSTALCWITRESQWGVFVGNRVKEIRSLTAPETWNHISGVHNAADLPSRGCSAKSLMTSKWWEGPNWLRAPEAEWPKSVIKTNEREINSEQRRSGVASLFTTHDGVGKWYTAYFSKYSRILRMTAWIQRFLDNSRKNPIDRIRRELSVEEIKQAEKSLLRIVQNEVFGTRESPELKSLSTFEDSDGLIRIRTGITRRVDEEEFKSPLILPPNHELVKLLIFEEHLRTSHAGVNVLLSNLRERFWILRGRKSIRSVISKCVKCRRYEAKKLDVCPIGLPADRVRDATVFEVTGVDLAGPLHLRTGEKAWIVLFTCAVYRAVHLELITSLSTASFMQSFRRFISRRGRPKVVYSDNGTNFVGTDNLFKSIDWGNIEADASVKRIQWKFNPPTAAWWGGWWERIVQMVKKLLRRVLGRASLSYEELLTVLCDCEAVINSRPLTYVSEDPNDLKPLTPAMFLQDTEMVAVPDLDHLDRVNLSRRIRYLQRLKQDLRKRFRVEYLGQLVQKKEKGLLRDIKVGDVVLVGNDTRRRIEWPLAKVVKLCPGQDRKVRVVQFEDCYRCNH